MVKNVKEDDGFDDIASAFRTSVGEGEYCSIKLFRKSDRTQKLEYIDNYPISDTNFELFIQQLRSDYKKGGEFKLTLIDAEGKTRGNKSLILADLEPATPGRAVAEPREARGNDNALLIAMMNNSQASQQQMTTLMMQMMQSSNQNMMQFITAIVPALSGGKESAVDILAKLNEIQKPTGSNDGFTLFKEAFGMARELINPRESDDEGGFLGPIVKSLPSLMEVLKSAPAAAPATPAPQNVAPQGIRPVRVPISNPSPPHQAQPAQPTNQEEAMQMLMEKYKPFMGQIAYLLERDYDAQSLADFTGSQIMAGLLNVNDVTDLLEYYRAAPAALPVILGLFGILEADDQSEVESALRLLLEQLDSSRQTQGGSGDAPGVGDDGPLQQAGQHVTGGQADGAETDNAPATEGAESGG